MFLNCLVLGGSKSQVPLIKAISAAGLSTVVCDQDANCLGREFSDFFYQISTHDYDAVLQVVNELEGLVFITTNSAYESPMRIVSRLSAKFNLKSYSEQALELTLNKKSLAVKLRASGINVPKEFILENKEAVDHLFENPDSQYIVKPLYGSQGSKGISLINSLTDLKASFASASEYSTNGNVLIQKYYVGKELTIDGMVISSQLTIFSICEKSNLGAQRGFITSSYINFIGNDLERVAIEDLTIKCIREIGVDNSFFSLDIKMTEQGPVIIDAGLMLDSKIDILLSYADIDVYQLYINAILKNEFPVKCTLDKIVGLKFLFSDETGVLMKNTNKDSIGWERQNGDFVCTASSISDIVGWILESGESVDQVLDRFSSIKSQDYFKVKNND